MIFLYPTDTIYGLGVDATDPEAVLRLQTLKGRPDGKPISVVVSDMDMLRQYAEVTPLGERLAAAFLPGKLTLVLQAVPGKLAPGVVSADGSVGFRIPAHDVPRALVEKIGKPITATSANVSDMETEKTPEAILAQFTDRASMITEVVDHGALTPSLPSTVVDARGSDPLIIREGAIPASLIQKL